MDYGAVFSGTLRLLWREKRLTLLSLIGTALMGIGTATYMTMLFDWQRRFFAMISSSVVLENGEMPEGFMSSLAVLLGGISIFMLLSLAAYIISLVTRAGGISEARLALDGGRVEVGRGLRSGLRRAARMFAIDLLWWLPAAVLFGGIYLVFFLTTFLPMSGISSGASEEQMTTAMSAATGGFFLFFCALACVGLLYVVIHSVFSPLMYQSAVQKQHSLGQAISEGWRLSRANLGPMLVLMLLSFVVALVVSVVMQLAALPLSAGAMGGIMTLASSVEQGSAPVAVSPVLGVITLLGSVFYAVALALLSAIAQAFNTTLYADVYRRLTAPAAGSAPDSLPPAALPELIEPVA